MFIAWSFLLLAITTEVAGTLTMNESGQTGDPLMYGLMCVFISSSYILLSFALRRMAVGVVIAIWEGFGTALITVISILFLGEPFSTKKAIGIGLAMLGILVLHFGEEKSEEFK
jgi:spermidine export protein MdtJ